MLRLHKLSSDPECFTPIVFQSGVNLILGERSDKVDSQGRKVNGVGKSISIELLHFALCRQHEKTRVSKIPSGVLPDELVVVLDLTIEETRLQIRRSIANPTQPTIIAADGSETVFENLGDASRYLGALLFENQEHSGQVSFRQVLSLLMRDEQSGFKDYLSPHNPKSSIPVDITPHLYLLGIDTSSYRSLLEPIQKLHSLKKVLKELKGLVTNGDKRKISDIPAILNEEEQAAKKIEEAIADLKADPAFEKVEADLNQLESSLGSLRGERKKLSFQIDQIRSIPLPERIDATDLKIVYNRIKSGLGNLVEKSLDQAKEFKAEIERFQQVLREDELKTLEKRRRNISTEIRLLSEKHSELTRQIDRQGVLKEITTGLEVATRRTDEYHRLASQFEMYEAKVTEVEDAKTERSNDLHSVTQMLAKEKERETSFNATIVDFHEKIQGTSRASFRFHVNSNPTVKRPLTYDIRVQDDGSNSINQVRVFLYDFALMFNEFSRLNHPGFLVHDNILEVDQDTLVKCLNFLHDKSEAEEDFQYILTLNRDKIEAEESQDDILLDIEGVKRASFSKSQQFLRKRYQETS